jgi:hypothetical protein
MGRIEVLLRTCLTDNQSKKKEIRIHKTLPPTTCTMFLYLLYKTPTCFGHITWSPSRSYKFGRRVQRIWQLVIDNWQTVYIYII